MPLVSTRTGASARGYGFGLDYFSPKQLSNLKLWLDASDTSTISLSGSNVTQWNDKSGNGYNFSQGTATRQPQSGTRTQNGKNILNFDGGDILVSTNTAATWNFLHNASKATIFMALVADTTTSMVVMDNSQESNTYVGIVLMQTSGTTIYHSVMNGDNTGNRVISASANIGASAGTFYETSILSDPTNATTANRSYIRRNGGTDVQANIGTGAYTTNNATYVLQIGARANMNDTFFDGAIGEIIIYQGLLNASERNLVDNYLRGKWAL